MPWSPFASPGTEGFPSFFRPTDQPWFRIAFCLLARDSTSIKWVKVEPRSTLWQSNCFHYLQTFVEAYLSVLIKDPLHSDFNILLHFSRTFVDLAYLIFVWFLFKKRDHLKIAFPNKAQSKKFRETFFIFQLFLAYQNNSKRGIRKVMYKSGQKKV